MLDSVRSLWLRVGRWPRLLAAATCLLLALLSALGTARARAAGRAPAPTVAVVVTAHALPAGHVLTGTDLRVERWPVALHPPSTPADTRALVGRRCAGAMAAQEPVTAPRVLGAGITTGLPGGVGAVPIAVVASRSVDYLRAGDRVDVLAGPPDNLAGATSGDDATAVQGGGAAAELVVGGATVLATEPGTDGQPALVIIGADRPTALRVARDEFSRTFTVVVVSP